jgi:hypothetical protein
MWPSSGRELSETEPCFHPCQSIQAAAELVAMKEKWDTDAAAQTAALKEALRKQLVRWLQ